MESHGRRTFLRYTGAAVVGAGLRGSATMEGGEVRNSDEVTVSVEAPAGPLVSRAFAILKDRIEQRCSAKVVQAGAGAQLVLSIDESLSHDAFRIDELDAAVRVSGGSPQGLLYGVGKSLRTSRYEGTFGPNSGPLYAIAVARGAISPPEPEWWCTAD